MYSVYILECTDRTLYTGITTDLERRLSEHRSKKGAVYTRSHGARRFVYTQACPNRSAALKREAAIKRLTRREKLALIAESSTS